MRRCLLLLAILLSLLLIFGVLVRNVSADKKELEEIRQAIKETGAKWKADETSISRLNPQERRKLLGTILDEVPPGQDKVKPDKPGKPEPPPLPPPPGSFGYYDWREPTANRLGLDVVTPIKNQGSCGSCWAFGAIAALESAYLIDTGSTTTDLSEQDLVSCCINCWGDSNDPERGCNGGYMVEAYEYLRKTGAIDETCFEYVADGVDCIDTECSRIRISDWIEVAPDLPALQEAIYEQPIPAAFYVFRDFYYYTEGVYSHVERGKPKPPLGGHAICIIGWDNENSCLIVKNSWGPGWGEDGFFRVAYTEIDNSVQFGRAAATYGGDTGILAPPKAELTIATMWGQIKM